METGIVIGATALSITEEKRLTESSRWK